MFPVRARVDLLKSGLPVTAGMLCTMESADGILLLGRERLLLCCSLGCRLVESILPRIVAGSQRTITTPFWSICEGTQQDDEGENQVPTRLPPHSLG